MNIRQSTAITLVTAFCAAPSLAQEAAAPRTLGEVLDLGAKPFAKAQLLPMLPLTRVYRWVDGNGETSQTFKADGTIKGTATLYAGGGTSPTYGYWKFKSDGQWCIDERFTAWNRGYEQCSFLYQVGDAIYAAQSDSDRNEPVRRAQLTPRSP